MTDQNDPALTATTMARLFLANIELAHEVM